jgi:hypothetical protein
VAADLSFLHEPPSPASAPGLAKLWEAVREKLPSNVSSALGTIHVGSVDTGHPIPWAHTNAGEDRVNLTLELKAGKLELNLVGWKEIQSDRLKDWLQSVRGEDRIAALEGYEVVAYRRTAYKKTPTSRPWWQEETIDELGRCAAERFNAGWVTRQIAGIGSRREEKPAFHVRRRWRVPPPDGDVFVAEIAVEVNRLMPILREIWDTAPSRAR